MGSNVGSGMRGYVQSTLEVEFSLLDRLPSPIRRAIQDAPYDISVRDVVDVWNRSQQEFNWDTMSYSRMDPISFARRFVNDMMIETRRLSTTGIEEGRYWLKKRPLTRRRRHVIVRSAYLIPTPKSRNGT